MAKAAAGETKAPLVIALVFFVLATIGLGVFAYTTSEDLSEAKTAKVEADKAKTLADDNTNKAREAALLYKVALGIANEEDQKGLQGIRFKTEAQNAHKAMIDAINAKSQQAIGAQVPKFVGSGAGFQAGVADFFAWTWPAGGEAPTAPTLSVLDGAVTARAQLELNERATKAEQDRLKSSTQTMVAKTTERDAETKKYKEETGKIPALIAADTDKARKSYEDKANQFGTQQAEARTSVQTAADKVAERDLQVKGQDERLKIQERKINDLLDREIDLIDPFKFDNPQGRILRRYSDSLVDIDLGTSDKLRAGIAFSIFPSDTTIRGMQPRMRPFKDANGKVAYKPIPKGKIEVIDVIGPNIAQCRIVDEDNAVRDRVIPGDLLYNALWRKGTSEHVALFGIFDLDGDGRDDTVSMIAGLRRIGVVVDAYYDLGKSKWEGEITSQTNFAIEGFYPTVNASDGNREGKIKVLNGIGEARKTVKEKGMLILRPRDAFPRIGFNARLEVSDDAINQAATGFSRAQFDAKPPAEGAPADPNAKPPEAPKVEK